MLHFCMNWTPAISISPRTGSILLRPEPPSPACPDLVGVTGHQSLSRPFFSCSYKLPIFYPLSFDIHASDGGCTPLPTFRHSNVSTFKRSTIYLLSSHTLPNSFALFCTYAKLNPFRFKQFRTLSQKHPGCGGTASAACSELLGVGGGPQGIAGSRLPQTWKCQVSFAQASASFGPAFFRLTIRSGSWGERACTISTLPPREPGAYSDSVFAFR